MRMSLILIMLRPLNEYWTGAPGVVRPYASGLIDSHSGRAHFNFGGQNSYVMKARDGVMKSRLAGTIASAGRNEHRQADWYIWALLSALIIRLSYRFPLDRDH